MLTACLLLAPVLGDAATVTFAGLSYSGDSKSIPARFPYSLLLEKTLATQGKPLNQQLAAKLAQDKPQHFELNRNGLTTLKGQDQAVVATLLITGETVSKERFDGVAKLMTQVRAQAMFFDFKNMTVLRAYPFSFTYLDLVDHDPSPQEMQQRFASLYYGDQGKPGIIQRFADIMRDASIPEHVPRFLQVAKVNIGDEARKALPAELTRIPGTAEAWAADLFAENLSSKTGVPLLPYSKGYAIGNVMSMRISDGEVFMLKLPEADYSIALDIPKFRRIKSGEASAGSSYIYGAYAHVNIQEPVSGKSYLDADFKNGEVKLVPASQDNIDDYPAYHDAIKGLFAKLADNLAGNRSDWLKSATNAPDIDKQITTTQQLLKACQ
ncbi:hypothetical protein BI347_08610 [Chromobacterium sphagni]|uniref:Uncharacterized protein n=1 Tax=Chromobacterium sphagni TaxID=1903179 RepID=A0A1S1X2D2_9NEIS|nr:hypothetical protein BI347_08610 [Chromobacterium sphagni]OHX22025.1 hypothetical protein BI344_05900 [Chromobacterium sphagni]